MVEGESDIQSLLEYANRSKSVDNASHFPIEEAAYVSDSLLCSVLGGAADGFQYGINFCILEGFCLGWDPMGPVVYEPEPDFVR